MKLKAYYATDTTPLRMELISENIGDVLVLGAFTGTLLKNTEPDGDVQLALALMLPDLFPTLQPIPELAEPSDSASAESL